MIGLIEGWRRRGRIRRAVRLRGVLRQRFGPSEVYSLAQVQSVAARRHVGQSDRGYLFAIYCSPADFDAAGVPGDYLELRRDVGAMLPGTGFAMREGLTDDDATRIGGGPDGGASHGGEGGGDGGGDGGGGGD